MLHLGLAAKACVLLRPYLLNIYTTWTNSMKLFVSSLGNARPTNVQWLYRIWKLQPRISRTRLYYCTQTLNTYLMRWRRALMRWNRSWRFSRIWCLLSKRIVEGLVLMLQRHFCLSHCFPIVFPESFAALCYCYADICACMSIFSCCCLCWA